MNGVNGVSGMFGSNGTLGDTRSDIIGVLTLALGKDKANKTLTDLETLVQTKAAAGTNQAIDAKLPQIRAQVHDEATKTVRPLFLGAMVIGSLGVLVGVTALILKKRQCPKER